MKQFYTHRLFWILPLACVMGMSSCKRFPNPFTNQKVLAEVGGERLYLHEYENGNRYDGFEIKRYLLHCLKI